MPYFVLDRLMLPGKSVERVAVETSHEEKDPLGALPPVVVFLAR